MTLAPACPILEFSTTQFHPGLNTSVRRGRRWHGVAEARIQLPGERLSPPLLLQTELRHFNTLNDVDLATEHDPDCRTYAGLLIAMQRMYRGFTAQEVVTLVHFTL